MERVRKQCGDELSRDSTRVPEKLFRVLGWDASGRNRVDGRIRQLISISEKPSLVVCLIAYTTTGIGDLSQGVALFARASCDSNARF